MLAASTRSAVLDSASLVLVPLADLDVLAVDCQTTGATPALGHVLEMGWAITRASNASTPLVQSTRVTLPPGTRISRIIAEITGIDRANPSQGATDPEQVWRSLCSAARATTDGEERPAPTIIHFARFELKFLHDWNVRFGGRRNHATDEEDDLPLPLDVLCVHEIAAKLYPNLPRRGLRALAGFCGYGLDMTRNSFGHVEATAFVWRRLVDELARLEVTTWGRLRDWMLEQSTPPPSTKRGKRVRSYPFARERRLALPRTPGVYRMLRSNGDVLYVGKALDVRQRISGHFTQGKTHERALEMLTQVMDIDVTPTASPLEAAVLETDEIKRLNPPYNVQLTRERSAWFASADLEQVKESPQAERWLGPLPSALSVSQLRAIVAIGARAMGCSDQALRARAMGVPHAFCPQAESFELGWRQFLREDVEIHASRTMRGRLMKAGHALLRRFGDGDLDLRGGDGSDPFRAWDPERIRRHLQRGVMSGYQLLRRARWLVLLSDAWVSYREANAERRRLLILEGGALVVARDLESKEAMFEPALRRKSWIERQSGFDGASYDRLRVLTTELKRVLSEGGDVEVVLVGPRIGRLGRGAVARALTGC